MKKIIIGLVILLIVLTPFVFGKKNSKVEYLSEPIEKRTITQIVEATGTIEPVTKVEVGTQVSGIISHIYKEQN